MVGNPNSAVPLRKGAPRGDSCRPEQSDSGAVASRPKHRVPGIPRPIRMPTQAPSSPASSGAAPSRIPRGVGLLGVLASLTVVAVLAGVAIPAFFGRHAVTLDNAAILLARDLRVVQNRAAHLGQPVSMRFDRYGWQGIDARGAALTRFASDELIERRLDADAVFEGVSLESISFGPQDQVDFDPLGRPARGGSLEVVFRGERRRLVFGAEDALVRLEGLSRPWVDRGF
jgi:Tfp pilus assembly protein FimT